VKPAWANSGTGALDPDTGYDDQAMAGRLSPPPAAVAASPRSQQNRTQRHRADPLPGDLVTVTVNERFGSGSPQYVPTGVMMRQRRELLT
jgi:hypothetical protein